MLAEDNKVFLENLTNYLELHGYKVLTTDGGKTVVDPAKEFILDLIVCDVLMREMDDHKVLRLLLAATKNILNPIYFQNYNFWEC